MYFDFKRPQTESTGREYISLDDGTVLFKLDSTWGKIRYITHTE